MARFEMQMPVDIMTDLTNIINNSDEIFGNMTKAGAEVVYMNIQGSIPPAWHGSNIMKCLKCTRVYKTPTDDGINCKVGFFGYFFNREGKKTPAPLVANVTEYGRSHSGMDYPKHPFFRKAFNKSAIEKAMYEAQLTGSGGLLTDE